MRFRRAALLAVLAWPSWAFAGEAEARFTVAAVVTPRATLELLAAPATVEISEGTLRRGYVDLETRYRVRNNDPRGFLLHLHPAAGYQGSVQVSGLGYEIELREDCVALRQPAAVQGRELALRVRVRLPESAAAGRMPVPLSISVTSL
jgi:hypothetical protein